MFLVKVQFDAYNRQFKLLDRAGLDFLDDGEKYVLVAGASLEDLKPAAQPAAQREVSPNAEHDIYAS